jgi:hypothetical protein
MGRNKRAWVKLYAIRDGMLLDADPSGRAV